MLLLGDPDSADRPALLGRVRDCYIADQVVALGLPTVSAPAVPHARDRGQL